MCTPNFVCVYFYWFENNICQKKNPTFLAQKMLENFFLSKSVLGYYKTKKKKKKKYFS